MTSTFMLKSEGKEALIARIEQLNKEGFFENEAAYRKALSNAERAYTENGEKLQ